MDKSIIRITEPFIKAEIQRLFDICHNATRDWVYPFSNSDITEFPYNGDDTAYGCVNKDGTIEISSLFLGKSCVEFLRFNIIYQLMTLYCGDVQKRKCKGKASRDYFFRICEIDEKLSKQQRREFNDYYAKMPPMKNELWAYDVEGNRFFVHRSIHQKKSFIQYDGLKTGSRLIKIHGRAVNKFEYLEVA
jgi:hypothetical protein